MKIKKLINNFIIFFSFSLIIDIILLVFFLSVKNERAVIHACTLDREAIFLFASPSELARRMYELGKL